MFRFSGEKPRQPPQWHHPTRALIQKQVHQADLPSWCCYGDALFQYQIHICSALICSWHVGEATDLWGPNAGHAGLCQGCILKASIIPFGKTHSEQEKWLLQMIQLKHDSVWQCQHSLTNPACCNSLSLSLVMSALIFPGWFSWFLTESLSLSLSLFYPHSVPRSFTLFLSSVSVWLYGAHCIPSKGNQWRGLCSSHTPIALHFLNSPFLKLIPVVFFSFGNGFCWSSR